MLGNQPVRFGKGELETCQRLESGNGECRFNRSRQPFWRRGNAPASYFMKQLTVPLNLVLVAKVKWLGKSAWN